MNYEEYQKGCHQCPSRIGLWGHLEIQVLSFDQKIVYIRYEKCAFYSHKDEWEQVHMFSIQRFDLWNILKLWNISF